MNSRSSVNETNLVNFSTDLSTLNQLDSKEGLLSFPFDHIYACHSESGDNRQSLQLDKEVEISTHCVISEEKDLVVSSSTEINQLSSRLTTFENQNRKLKDLLVYHLDLIQQQNEVITKREKSYQALKLENDTLRSRLSRMDRRLGGAQRSVNPPPLVHVPTTTAVTSTVVKNEPTSISKIKLNTFSDFLLPEKDPFVFESDLNKAKALDEESSDLIKTEAEISLVETNWPEYFDLPKIPGDSLNLTMEDFLKNFSAPEDSICFAGHASLDFGFTEEDLSFFEMPCPEFSDSPNNKKESSSANPIESDPNPGQSTPKDTSFLPNEVTAKSSGSDNNFNEKFTMIESKRSYVKKEIKTEPRADALYTVTSNSGNPVIQRIQRTKKKTTAISSINRISKLPKVETPKISTVYDETYDFSVNKKSKMINTYGKNRNTSRKTSQFTGSLSDRLRLIDTTPTGEDPYQLGEADMREQSPIPKLMLQKTNHGKMKICTETGETSNRRIYEPIPETITKPNKIKQERYNLSTSTYTHSATVKRESPKTLIVEEPDLDIVKTEPEIDWRIYNKSGNETSLCDFSYGENPDTLSTDILPSLDTVEFHDLFQTETPLNLDSLNLDDYSIPDKTVNDKSKRRAARTTSLIGANLPSNEALDAQDSGTDNKRGRKRALSTTGLAKGIKNTKLVAPKPKLNKGKAACRGKKSPVPGMVTNEPYHTSVGDSDLSWYLGLGPDVKLEDMDPTNESKVSTVEVPRWREKPYTSCYTLEGTENLDDKVFEKRHQKLEAEERRQLRWHMRRIREQRHMERLRQRQRDSWMGGNSPNISPYFTIWPQAQRDLRFIEITDTLPVLAFGESVPSLPAADFVLPWVRTSKPLKRSKRSKTLH